MVQYISWRWCAPLAVTETNLLLQAMMSLVSNKEVSVNEDWYLPLESGGQLADAFAELLSDVVPEIFHASTMKRQLDVDP